MVGGSCLRRVQRLSCGLSSKTNVQLPLRFVRVMLVGVVFQANVVILMMSVMLCLWPASFSIAEPVAKGSLHTKDHRLSRSDEPFRNTTGSVNLDPKNIRFGGQTVATLGQKKLEFWGQIWVPKRDLFWPPKLGLLVPPIKTLIGNSF